MTYHSDVDTQMINALRAAQKAGLPKQLAADLVHAARRTVNALPNGGNYFCRLLDQLDMVFDEDQNDSFVL